MKFGELEIKAKGWFLNLIGVAIVLMAAGPVFLGMAFGISFKIELKEVK